MTVCVAALFKWNIGKADQDPVYETAAFTISDRMITAGDVQYEPSQQKVAYIPPSTAILIAGDYGTHSQALKDTIAATRSSSAPKVMDIATTYGRAIQAIKRRQAEDLFLAPLGLNTDTFHAQQREFSDRFVDEMTSRMTGYRGDDVEAIVVGADAGVVQLYTVDTNGVAACCDDVGFAAIGMGAWHAKSVLMQSRYTNNFIFAPALATVFAAKKSAEIAPGVGQDSDINVVFKDGVFRLDKIWPDMPAQLERIYAEYAAKRSTAASEAVTEVNELLRPIPVPTPSPASEHAEQKGFSGGDPKTDGGAPAATPEAPRPDEAKGGSQKEGRA